MTWQLSRTARPTSYPLPYSATTSARDKKIYIASYDEQCLHYACQIKRKKTNKWDREQGKLSLMRKINLSKTDLSRPAFSHHHLGFWSKCHGVSKKHFLESLYQQTPGCLVCEPWTWRKGRYSKQKTVQQSKQQIYMLVSSFNAKTLENVMNN